MDSLASILIGFGVAIIGMSLICDPWAQERYERTIRETARLENSLLPDLSTLFHFRMLIGYSLILASFITMNRIKILFILSIPIVICYGAIHFNPIMYKSDRFGGYQTICGVLLYLSICCTILQTRKLNVISKPKEE